MWGKKAVAGALLAATLSGCGVLGGATGQDDPRSGEVEAPFSAPYAFADKARWQADAVPDSPVLISQYGIIVVVPGPTDTSYAIACLDPETGEQRWSSRPISAPGGVPSVGITREGDRDWIILHAPDGEVTSTYTYDPLVEAGDRVKALTSASFAGEGEAPQVIVGERGVLVLGAKDSAAIQYHPHLRKTTVLKGVPKREGKEGEPVEVYDDGFVMAFPEGGFAYAAASGGWDSARVAPEGVDRAKGALIDTQGGLLLAEWPSDAGEGGNQTLWLHDLRSGEPLIELDADDEAISRQKDEGVGIVRSFDGRKVAWGDFLFDLEQGEAKSLTLNGAEPTSIYAETLYATGAEAPLPDTPPRPGPGVDADGSEGPSHPEGEFSGNVSLDLISGRPVPGVADESPIGFDSLGQGIFRHGSKVYAFNSR